jgi:phosphatidylinositol alpha-1,6-mannosyltransferase
VREDLRPAPKDPGYVERLGLDGKLVFLTVGRLIERKGIDTMLQALAGIDRKLPPWHYLVVSDGPYRAALEEQCRSLGLQDRVTFTGFVNDDEIPVYYNLCDVFAMPNREVKSDTGSSLSVEGFGMVFVDAAACGKPVIAGRSGGAVDALADGVNGILVEPGDVDSLRQALLRLADPDLRARMGAAGIEFAARFQWDETVRRLRNFL